MYGIFKPIKRSYIFLIYVSNSNLYIRIHYLYTFFSVLPAYHYVAFAQHIRDTYSYNETKIKLKINTIIFITSPTQHHHNLILHYTSHIYIYTMLREEVLLQFPLHIHRILYLKRIVNCRWFI